MAGAEQEADGAALLGRQLQAPPGGQVDGPRLADNAAEGRTAQPFLHAPQHLGIVTGAGHQQAVGRQPHDGEAGTIQRIVGRALGDHPQHRPAGAGGKTGDEGEGRTGEAILAARHLVQPPKGQAAPRQYGIHRRHADGEHRRGLCPRPFEGPDTGPQGFQMRCIGHRRAPFAWTFVLFMFYS